MTTTKLPPARVRGVENQPLGRIEWVPREQLRANSYNPNHVAPIELHLLKVSVLEDGWTQPIVARPDGEITDGFHRWLVSEDPEIYAMTDGKVPVVRLISADRDHQMMSTIRHNRARGTHAVLKMAEIVRDLIDNQGLTYEEVMSRLQMEWEEVDRLYDRGGMTKRGSKADFNKGWVPE
jgi:ParB-like chromosome segregation protein Spo0J